METETEDSRNDGCRAESTCYPLPRKSRRSNYFSRMVRSLKDRGGDWFRVEIWPSTRGRTKEKKRNWRVSSREFEFGYKSSRI